MITRECSAVLAVLFTTWALHAQEGPAKPRVGDWVVMKISNPPREVTTKQIVIAVDELNATVKDAVLGRRLGGVTRRPIELEIALTELRDPTKTYTRAGAYPVKMEKLKEGKETLVVKGIKLNCDWIELRRTVDTKGMAVTSTHKIWTCPDVPLSGIVKTETDFPQKGEKSMSELVDYGRGK